MRVRVIVDARDGREVEIWTAGDHVAIAVVRRGAKFSGETVALPLELAKRVRSILDDAIRAIETEGTPTRPTRPK